MRLCGVVVAVGMGTCWCWATLSCPVVEAPWLRHAQHSLEVCNVNQARRVLVHGSYKLLEISV